MHIQPPVSSDTAQSSQAARKAACVLSSETLAAALRVASTAAAREMAGQVRRMRSLPVPTNERTN